MLEISREKIGPAWKEQIDEEFSKPYMVKLHQFLCDQQKKGKVIYPPVDDTFRALALTSFEKVKVVILGQDPYHGPKQAHGLCFSVKPGIKKPPSLNNLFKELESDLSIPVASHGCLDSWAKQGVLMLNAVLTVEEGLAASHQKQGWETFTDHLMTQLSKRKSSVIFVLWGAYAQKKESLIDLSKNHVIKSAHPSPLSAHRGFFGSRPFSKINRILKRQGLTPIDWQLPDAHEAI